MSDTAARILNRLHQEALDENEERPDHSECIHPHLNPDGEHADCDGNLL
ncbi:hypothetical protein ACIOYT_00810 [Streptomyces halstedii]